METIKMLFVVKKCSAQFYPFQVGFAAFA